MAGSKRRPASPQFVNNQRVRVPHLFTERFSTVRKDIDSSFLQKCCDVLGDPAVHRWGVVATGQEQILEVAGLKLQHFR
jgi:hypothetical protein